MTESAHKNAHICALLQGTPPLTKWLENTPFTLHTAHDEHELLEQCRLFQPSVVILDDIATCQYLQPRVLAPLLMIVAPEDTDAALAAGAADCVTTSVHPRLLQRRLHTLSTLHPLHLYDNLPIMCHAVDPQGRIRYVNHAWQRTTGYSQAEVQDRPIGDILVSETQRSHNERENNPVYRQLLCKGGTERHVLLDRKPIHLAEGGASVELVFLRDITPLTSAEASLHETEQRYRRLFSSANDGILLVDVERRTVVECNPQLARMLGYTPSELIGKPIDALQASDDDVPTPQEHNPATTQRLITEGYYRRQDGSLLPVESSSRVIHYQGRLTILSFLRDITERQQALRAEQDQRQLAEALRDIVSALNHTLNLDEVFDAILASVTRVVPADSTNIMLVNEGITTIVRHRGYVEAGFEARAIEEMEFVIDEVDNLKRAAQRKQPIIISETHAPGIRWEDTQTRDFVRSIITAPIVLDDAIIGFINVDSREPGRFRADEHAERMEIFANQAAIAIRNARLYRQAQQHAEQLEERVAERTAELTASNQALMDQIAQREAVEELLQIEQTLLRTMIDHIPDPIYVKNPQGEMVLANRAALRVAQVDSVQSMLTADGERLFPDATMSRRARAQDDAVLKEGWGMHNHEDSYKDVFGSTRWVLSTKIPLKDARGERLGMVAILRDITDLKQTQATLAEERNLLRSVLDALPDPVYLKDEACRLVLVNDALLQDFHVSRAEELLGKSDRDLEIAPKRAQRLYEQEQRILRTGIPIRNQLEEFVDASGRQRYSLVTKLPMRDGQGDIVGIIGTNHDITELRLAEEQLEQVMTSARCLLWTAIARRTERGIQWETLVANEQAAQLFLPFQSDTLSYAQAWEQSIVPADRHRRRVSLQWYIVSPTHSRVSQEFRCTLPDERIVWLAEDVKIQELGINRWRLTGVCTDITERKQVEMNLQNLTDELEQRVQARTEQLVRANQNLRQQIAERKRAEVAERHQRILAEALHDSSDMLNSTLDLDAILDHLLEAMTPVIPHDAANIMLLDNDEVRIVRSWGYDPPLGGTPTPLQGWTHLYRVYQTGDPIFVDDTRQDDHWQPFPQATWVRSNLCVPIPLEDHIIGFLNLDSALTHNFSPEHAAWLRAFANQAGLAIRNARRVSEIRRHANELEARVEERTRELVHERAQLRAILNAIRDGVLYQEPSLHVSPQYINNALTTITGYSQDEWLMGVAQRHLNADEAEENAINWKTIHRTLEEDGYWEGEIRLRHKRGHVFDAAVTRSAVFNSRGEQAGIVTVLRDISQAKQLEEQKKRFITSSSHELRTPIANIKTRLFLLRRQPEHWQEHLDVLDNVADLMQQLVEDMFDISRFEHGTLKLSSKTIVAQELIAQVLRYHQPQADQRNITLQSELPAEPLTLHVDPSRMTQVLNNLIVNALDHVGEGGTVLLRAGQDGQHFVLHVIDDGPGIEPELLPHLFEPFYRADDDRQGAGLGLSIVREIVRAYGGSIHVESTSEQGSDFVVRLPLDTMVSSSKQQGA